MRLSQVDGRSKDAPVLRLIAFRKRQLDPGRRQHGAGEQAGKPHKGTRAKTSDLLAASSGRVEEMLHDPDLLAGRLAISVSPLNVVLPMVREGRLIALAESYPDLKANQTMMQLSEELTSTENRVAFSRQAYNDAVMNYNNRRETFPGNIFAGMFGFTQAALLEIPPDRPEMRDAPRVQF